MANWALITYTRVSTDKAWPTPGAMGSFAFYGSDIINKVTEYQNTEPNKIIHYETADSADGLKKYFKIGFLDLDTALSFGNTPENLAKNELRDNFCNNPDNGITCLVDGGLDDEPSIPA